MSTASPELEPLPSFTLDEISGIYDELGSLSVALDDDPLAFGPKRLNGKVSLVRRALDRCERIFLDISHRLQIARRMLRIATVTFNLGKRNLFANDPETRGGASVVDREAIAAGKLAKELQRMNDLLILEGDLDAVLDVVKAKRTDLKDTESRLRDQMRLCQEELGLGTRWGSRVPGASVDVEGGRSAGTGDDVLDGLLGRIDGEVALAADGGNWPDAPLPDLDEDDVSASPTFTDPADQSAGKTTPKKTAPKPAPIEAAKPASIEAPIEPPKPAPVGITVAPAAEPDAAPVVLADLLGDRKGDEPASTASGSAVDDFLDSLPMTTAPAQKEASKSKHVALDDGDLMSLLMDFEADPGLPSPKVP